MQEEYGKKKKKWWYKILVKNLQRERIITLGELPSFEKEANNQIKRNISE